ncbi:MAG: NAD-dependent DNA ligase LigA, partial [Chloroflexi bacterium]|nr:NAD-dependent DNA ligase LigA [Chloroflexota bacterium]
GRTGSLNPYAILEPVRVSGVIVKQATLHNEEDIRRKDLHVQDYVVVERAGEVIPQVIKPDKSRRPSDKTCDRCGSYFHPTVEHPSGIQWEGHMPATCPVCRATVRREPEEAMYYCVNASCPARLFEGLRHFTGVMEIEGVGDALCAQLLDKGLVKDIADLYSLTKERMLTLERMGDKLATKLLKQVQESESRPLARLIFALGIRHVGERVAELLAQHFGSVAALAKASVEDITQVPTVGPAIAESVVAYFREPRNLQVIEKLRKAGLRMAEEATAGAVGPRPLAGKTFVITGTLDALSREKAEAKIKEMGGVAGSSVTRKTDYLVAGRDPGSKLDKARQLGTKLLTEAEFLDMLQQAEGQPSPGS